MGLKITTDDKPVVVRCFDKTSKAGNPYKDYCLKVASKDTDGEWHNALLNVKFKKGVNVVDKSKIKINNCFPTVDEYNEKSYIKWMITDFEVVEEGVSNEQKVDVDADGFMNVDGLDEELPFV